VSLGASCKFQFLFDGDDNDDDRGDNIINNDHSLNTIMPRETREKKNGDEETLILESGGVSVADFSHIQHGAEEILSNTVPSCC
jgi:hypothetical protein